MTRKGIRHETADLRSQAEDIVSEKISRLPESPDLSSEEARRALHELQVHQIELEIQNEELRRVNVELDTVRERYFDLYNLAPVGYITLSEKGLFLEANLTAATLLGVARGVLVKLPISRFIFKEDQDIYYLHRKQVFETDEQRALDLRMVKQDGTVFWVHLETTAARDATGELVYRDMLIDITKRKLAEQALRESQMRTEAILEGIADTFYSLDNEWRFAVVNPAAGRAPFGRSAAELLGRVIWEVYPNLVGTPIHQRYLDAAEKLSLEHYTAQSPLNERWYEVFMQGWSGGVDVYMRDITEQKRADEELKKSERLYRAIGESIDFGVWVCAPDGRNIYASESFLKLVGLTQKQCSDFGWGDVLHPDDTERTIAAWKECVRSEATWDIEHRFHGVDQQWHPILARGVPVKDDSGNILYWAGINLDISRLKQAESALLESEERFRSVLDTSQDIIYRLNVQTGRYAYISPSVEKIIGYSAEELMEQEVETALAMIHPDDLPAVLASHVSLEETGENELDYRQRTKGGDYRWISARLSLIRDSADRPLYRSGNLRDITERKLHEEKIAKLTGLYDVLSQVNEAIVRIRDVETFYTEVCRIISEVGGFQLVWIGLVENKMVVPAAFCGSASDYLKEIKVEVSGKFGEGPTGTSIRENRPVVNDDFITNPSTLPWRQPATQFGVRSSASFPLRRGGDAVGALVLYSNAPNTFDAEQVALLESLSSDISYALDTIELEQFRVRAEHALQASETRYRRLFEAAKDGILILNSETKNIIDVNPFLAKLLGYEAGEIIGKNLWEIGPFRNTAASIASLEELQQNTFIRYEDLPLETKDGRLIEVEFVSNVYVVDSVKVIQCNIRDITERKLAQEELRQTRNYLDKLLRYANAPIIVWNPDMLITLFNHAFEKLTGYSSEEAIGCELGILFPSESRKEAFESIVRTVSGEYWETVEIPILRKDGRVRIVLWNSANIVEADGVTLVATIAQGQDITERKRAEEALERARYELEERVRLRTRELHDLNKELQEEIITRRIAEDKLRETGEILEKTFSTTHICIAYLDREFTYLRVNRAYAEEYGLDENFLVGRNHFALFPDAMNKEIFQRTVETGESYSAFAQPFENPGMPERGVIYLDWSLNPVKDHNGLVEGLIYILVNVTERKMLEDTIRGNQVRLKEAQRIAHLGYWEWDVRTNELYWSEETFNIYGRNPVDFSPAYERFLECIHPEDREQVIHSVDDAIRGKTHYNVEHRLIKPDHSVRFVNEQGEVTFDTDGRAVRMVGTVLDITPLKILEQKRTEAIQLAERAWRLASIGEVAGGITHEINQPLNAIKVTVDGILLWHRNNLGLVPEQFITMLEKISGSADRINNIIKHMRAFWVTPDNRVEEVFNINEIVTQALSLITRQLSSHGIKTVTKFSGPPLYITGNPLHIEQIVVNLVHNSMNSLDSVSRQDKVLLIETLRGENAVQLRVTDNGTGLPEGIGDRLFDPFFSTRQPGEGTGLGLAMVKRFVEEHKGFIRYENNPSGGAAFTIHFPISQTVKENNNEHTSC